MSLTKGTTYNDNYGDEYYYGYSKYLSVIYDEYNYENT